MENKLDVKQLNEVSKPEDFRSMLPLQRRTKLERVFFFSTAVSLFMVAVLVVALVALGYLYQKKTEPGKRNFNSLNADSLLSTESSVSNLCLTPGCIKTAAEILSNLDENVEPCDDFYHFACGGWINRSSIPEYMRLISASLESYDSYNLEVKGLLKKELDGTEPDFILKLKNVYHTCTDINGIEKVGAKPLRKILKSMGGWPVVEGRTWNEDRFDWIETLKSFRKHGYELESLLTLTVGVDKHNNSLHVIEIDRPYFLVAAHQLILGLNNSYTAAYLKMMVKAAHLLGANKAAAEIELQDVIQFEMNIAKYAGRWEGRTHNVSKFYNKFTVKELEGWAPEIPWLRFFNSVLNDEIYENDTVVVALPEFVKKLAALIEITDKRVIANYMLWGVVRQSLSFLSRPWSEIRSEYYTVSFGFHHESPRWHECLMRLYSTIAMSVGSYYASHYLKKDTKDAASEVAQYVHQQFLHTLDKINWMDEVTKTHAKSKASDMVFYIGYPEELLNTSAVAEHYQNLHISNDSYFENILRIQKWSKDNAFSLLRKPNRRREWKRYAWGVAPYNFFPDNSIELPALRLRSPFFRKDRPNYLNFGAIGFVAAKEIISAFDYLGRQYDENGNNANWWTKTTDEQFKKKGRCVKDQYNNFREENGWNLNGVEESHIAERNIVNNGAMREAYQAYQTWVKDNGPEQVLPGLKYSQNQLYWISAANVCCSKYKDSRIHYDGDETPAKFRVIGPMSNLAEFAEDFKCPLQSPMNPKHKCQVW